MTRLCKIPDLQQEEKIEKPQPEPLPAGTYHVRVEWFNDNLEGVLSAKYMVATGEQPGKAIWERFEPGHPKARKRLHAFLRAVRVRPDIDVFDMDACVGRELLITVVNKGKWANVVRHEALPNQEAMDNEH